MILLLLTADYEIFGNGSGDVQKCLIEPTDSLLAVCNKYNVPITFFLDVCEYWAFKEEETVGNLPVGHNPAQDIEKQVERIISAGHDIQLHLHPQWVDYEYLLNNEWKVNYDYWRLSQVPVNVIRDLFVRGKKTLEDLIQPFKKDYKCFAFRAGAWGIQPEKEILNVMKETGFLIDSTVMPRINLDNGLTKFNFNNAPINVPAWRINDNVCIPKDEGKFWELPIFTFKNSITEKIKRKLTRAQSISKKRLVGCNGSLPKILITKRKTKLINIVSRFNKYTMFDFCSMNANEMVGAIKKANKRFSNGSSEYFPIVTIGHPKGFANETELSKFINSCIDSFKDKIRFGTYSDWLDIVDNNDLKS